jgi:GrpB-like predicted nucleotidyltransferase (UPF0157 family)
MASRVDIVEYDEGWPGRFLEAQQKLAGILSIPIASIDHVGSTAVPGLAAKPLIDIDICLQHANSMAAACAQLKGAGYQPRGERYGDGVFAFLKPGNPGCRVYLCPPESETHHKRMVFRDRLRADANLARDYAKLKQELAVQYRYDGDGYTRAKTEFIAKAIGGLM